MSEGASKTKIVATIGPASQERAVLEQMIEAGMNVARLNFAHGDFASHGATIQMVRAAAAKLGRRVAIMADLPGPKLRIGQLAHSPVELERGQNFTLSVGDFEGDATRAATTFARLPEVVGEGDLIYLNDGLVQLRVEQIAGRDVRTVIAAGGPLLSDKGINLPAVDLGIGAFTERDKECLKFALSQGVDAIGQSFVQSADDVLAVRAAARDAGGAPLVFAKIERAVALERIDEILAAADGIMVARGDLGVEIPIERIAIAQKDLIRKANLVRSRRSRATQMLALDGREPAPDPGRGDRRRQRHPRWYRLRHALRGIGGRRLPGRGRAHAATDRQRHRAASPAALRPGLAGASAGGGERYRAGGGERRSHRRADPAARDRGAERQRRHRPPHGGLPPAGLDHGGLPLGADLPGAAVRLRRRPDPSARNRRPAGPNSPGAILRAAAPAGCC